MFDPDSLHTLATAPNGFKLHKYTTTDTLSQVEASGYFNDAAADMLTDDIVWVRCAHDTTPGMVNYVNFVVYHVAENDVRITRCIFPTEVALP